MSTQTENDDYELREEYDLAQMVIVPKGRFEPGRRKGKNIVVLAPDLAQAFPDDTSVNQALRLVLQISLIPKGQEAESAPA